MLEGAQSPCRRELSAAQEPGELLLAQGWNPWEATEFPAGDREGRSHSRLPGKCPHEGLWIHPAVSEWKDLGMLSCLNCSVFILLSHWILKDARSADFVENPLFCTIPWLRPALPCSDPCHRQGKKWIREVRASGEVKGSLRSAVIKMSPFFFLSNQWGSLCGWTQTLFLGSRLYPCGDCGSGWIILKEDGP